MVNRSQRMGVSLIFQESRISWWPLGQYYLLYFTVIVLSSGQAHFSEV